MAVDIAFLGGYNGRMKDLHPIISENLAILRKTSGLTQSQLAERLNYSDKAVSRWEKGDTLPDINVLYELCDFYGITMEMLLERGGIADRKQIKTRNSLQFHLAVCALAIGIVWLIATIFFVYLNTITGTNFWQAFIWAIPASCVVTLWMNRKYHSTTVAFICTTIFIWTVLTAIYLQFINYNIWLVYIIGIPVQAICILWFVVRRFK